MTTQCSLCHCSLNNTLDTYGPWDLPLCQRCWFDNLSDLAGLHRRLGERQPETQLALVEDDALLEVGG